MVTSLHSDSRREIGSGAPKLHVGIIADLHDHLVNFTAFLKATADSHLDELWIAGDLGTPETLEVICRQFPGLVRVVPGNVEEGHRLSSYALLSQQFPNLIWSDNPTLVWSCRDTLVSMSHHPVRHPSPAKAPDQKQLVISGHTHRPTLTRLRAGWSLNPGTLGGVFTAATYVLADFPGPYVSLKQLYPNR